MAVPTLGWRVNVQWFVAPASESGSAGASDGDGGGGGALFVGALLSRWRSRNCCCCCSCTPGNLVQSSTDSTIKYTALRYALYIYTVSHLVGNIVLSYLILLLSGVFPNLI